MNSIAYTPEPGSPADRVLDLLARNPQEEYTSSDLALKFQVPKGRWDVLLAEPVAKGLIHRDKTAADPNVIWCAGASLKAWYAQRSGTTLPPALGGPKAKKPPRAGVPHRLAPLDIATITVETGGAIAENIGPCGVSKWDAMFALLKKPNTSVAVPLAYRGTLAAYVRKRKKDGRMAGTYLVGVDAADRTKCRVLRTA